MKFLIQRVNHASVKVDGEITGEIGLGFLVLIGVSESISQKFSGIQYYCEGSVVLQIYFHVCSEDSGGCGIIHSSALLYNIFIQFVGLIKGNRRQNDKKTHWPSDI